MSFLGSAAQTSIWPTASYGQLGSASKPTWSASFEIEWRIFDGGARKHELKLPNPLAAKRKTK